jgi:hypothetical protein
LSLREGGRRNDLLRQKYQLRNHRHQNQNLFQNLRKKNITTPYEMDFVMSFQGQSTKVARCQEIPMFQQNVLPDFFCIEAITLLFVLI